MFYCQFLLLLKVNGKSEASQSVSPTNEEAFKRGESLRLEPQKHKRTPSFTTRFCVLNINFSSSSHISGDEHKALDVT